MPRAEDREEKKGWLAERFAGPGPWYFRTLFVFFILPFLFLLRVILKHVQKKPFYLTIGLVCVLGWAWSMLLSYLGWWEFPEKFLLGWHPLPFLPLEEFIIYPLGGAFSIFLYVYPSRRLSVRRGAAGYWIFLIAVTAAFVALAVIYRDTRPYYLYSQFALYNGLALALAPWAAREINLAGLVAAVAALGALGYCWDYLAFRYGWWVYHAITGVRVQNIPVEDFNFYLMAPTAAISLYALFCRKFNLPQAPPPAP